MRPRRRHPTGLRFDDPHLWWFLLGGKPWDRSSECASPGDDPQRCRTIEPVFGQAKTVQGGGRFMRRGLQACQAEWKLLCGAHNLLKLWRATTTTSS